MFEVVHTPRLCLRPLRAEDEPPMVAYRSDPEVVRFQSWEVDSAREVAGLIRCMAEREPDSPGQWYQLGIALADGPLIGDCGIHTLHQDPRQSEIGITLARDHQRQGYGLEALGALLGFLFEGLGKHRVIASVDPRNLASVALMGRLGMRLEAHHVESLWFKGAWADDMVFAMLRREWRGLENNG